MATAILQPSHFAAVRAAIDVRLDGNTLPDAVIAQPIYLGAAELEVRQRDTLYATRTGDDLERLVQACILLTAARLVHAVPFVTGHVLGGASKFNAGRNLNEVVAALRASAYQHIAALGSTPEAPKVAVMPPYFAVASGRRGR